MLLQKVPADFACAITGHAPDERVSNIISYYNDMFLLTSYPGARVLSGQMHPPYGHLCGPPPSPRLVPSPYPSDDWDKKIQTFIITLFSIDDSTHPKLRRVCFIVNMCRTARTSDRGCHIVASAGIAAPVLRIAPAAQVRE